VQYTVKNISGYKTHHYDVLDSTQTQSKLLIDSENNIHQVVITTDVQTAGKGRSGREWDSDEGNLFYSIILNDKTKQNYQLYTFVTSLALAKTLDDIGLKSQIKWPNDVLVNGAKISGILLETYKDHLIVGVGINVISHPEFIDSIIGLSATDILNEGVIIHPEDLLVKFISCFNAYDSKFKTSGFLSLRDELLARAYNYKQKITVRYGSETITGIFEDIDEGGHIIIKTDSGSISMNAGEVFGV
jgi:BirA family biotin operon repressor/biotin-[acetyl-CoA-carboxylase] ligase